MNPSLQPLFAPFQVRSLHLANRAVMAPMGRPFARDGVPSDLAAAYYASRARGEVGLVITEATGIDHPLATDHPGVAVMHGEAALDGWRRVVEAVHAEGGKIIPQLWHQGMLRGGSAADPTMASLRPSGIVGEPGSTSFTPGFVEGVVRPTAPMTDADIADTIAGFARAAAAAAGLGFDGVELHGAHGYLIDSFLWEASNRRADRFGGSHAARATFAAEVVRAVRASTPPDFPIFFRFSQHKSHNYDARIADDPATLEALLGPIADAGADVLDASTRRFWQPAFEGSPLNLAGWAKKLTGLPTIAVGSVGLNNTASDTFQAREGAREDNVLRMLERLGSGEFDLIGIGRSLIGDAAYVRKLRTGEALTPFVRAQLEALT